MADLSAITSGLAEKSIGSGAGGSMVVGCAGWCVCEKVLRGSVDDAAVEGAAGAGAAAAVAGASPGSLVALRGGVMGDMGGRVGDPARWLEEDSTALPSVFTVKAGILNGGDGCRVRAGAWVLVGSTRGRCSRTRYLYLRYSLMDREMVAQRPALTVSSMKW